MSVEVSYKKQTLFGIIGLVIILGVLEIAANVWWISAIQCEFEENEIFLQMDDDKNGINENSKNVTFEWEQKYNKLRHKNTIFGWK